MALSIKSSLSSCEDISVQDLVIPCVSVRLCTLTLIERSAKADTESFRFVENMNDVEAIDRPLNCIENPKQDDGKTRR